MPDANALDPSTLMSAPVAQWLALQRAKNTAEGIGDDNLLNRVFSRGDPYYAPPPTPAGIRPIWSPDNPVGTSVLHDTYAGPASSSFSPLVTRPYADVPITAAKAAEIETGARDYSLNLFGNLALAEVPDIGRLPGEPVALPSKRVRAPGADRPPEPGTRKARNASLDGHLPFPDAEDPAAQEEPTAPSAPAPGPLPGPSAEPPAPVARVAADGTIVADGTPVGRVKYEHGDQVTRIADIQIDPPSQNQGIGSAAIRQIQDEAAARNNPVVLSTDAFRGQKAQVDQRRLYERLGFVPNKGPAAVSENIGGKRVAEELVWQPPAPAAAGPVSHSLDGHVPFPDAAPTPPPGAPEPAPEPASPPPPAMRANALDIASMASQFGPADMASIRAFHGSPHDFNAFDLSKIGTGEGAQAYGHGLYFAESEKVARGYKNKLTGTNKFGNGYTVPMTLDGEPVTSRSWPSISDKLYASGDSEGGFLATVLGDANRYNVQSMGALKKAYADPNHPLTLPYDNPFAKPGDPQATLDATFKALRARAVFAPPRGRMYEVSLNADPEHFLDWDKPLSEQSQHVQDALTKSGFDLSHDPRSAAYGRERTGGEFYKAADPAQMATDMHAAGIPGIKYLDQGSRSQGQGTSNYVIFDPKTIEILRKYGIAGLIAGGGAAATGTSSQNQQ